MRRSAYQVIWLGWREALRWPPVTRPIPYPDHPGEPHHACIYTWMIAVGPVEVRRWAPQHVQSSAPFHGDTATLERLRDHDLRKR